MERGLVRRVGRNMGWLVGGKAVGGLLSLVYLGIAARLLGPHDFGVFAIVAAFGQAVANLVQFQSSQLVIRFGAAHKTNGCQPAFAALIGFSTLLDLAGAILSAVVGFTFVGLIGSFFGWTSEVVELGGWFSLTLVLWLRATPTGILRLLGRFDQLSFAETMTPLVRFVGALVALTLPASVAVFLAIWALSELAASLVLWHLAIREQRRAGLAPVIARPIGVIAANPGLWRFALASNALASLNLVWQQLGTLAVGGVVGTEAAGGFRIAFQFAQALAKPALLLGRVIFPELAHLSATGREHATVWKSSGTAAIGGVAMVIVTALLGKTVLTIVAGPAYADAAPLLVVLSLSAAIDLAGFALEPALLATGRAGLALAARTAGAVAYALLLALTIDKFGAFGVAGSAVAGSAITVAVSLLLVMSATRRPASRPDPAR